MSPTTGSGLSAQTRRIAGRQARFGTATRTMSQPAAARRPICSSVPAASSEGRFVIDCMETGAPPPIFTPPKSICRVSRMVIPLILPFFLPLYLTFSPSFRSSLSVAGASSRQRAA